MNLTQQERALLKKYQSLNSDRATMIGRLAIEILPPVLFVAIGLYTGSITWFLVLITVLVFYNVQRVLRQAKILKLLSAISEKVSSEEVTSGEA